MSIYAIGDLHGRIDLFEYLLEKIKFDMTNDKLYILGDVIDRSYGGVQILNYILKHKNSFELILGNHELHFLSKEKSYNYIMSNDDIKNRLSIIMKYNTSVFWSIYDELYLLLDSKDIKSFYNINDLENILNTKPKQKFFETLIELLDHINYDRDKFDKIKDVILDMDSQYSRKNFTKELITISYTEYIKIIEYLKTRPNFINLEVNNNDFFLCHSLVDRTRYIIPLAKMNNTTIEFKNKYILYGHIPIGSLHRDIQMLGKPRYDFNYREVFSYVDFDNNKYFNLDLSTSEVVAINLETLEEYYIFKPLRKTTVNHQYEVPDKSINNRKTNYKLINENEIISYKDYCMEYYIKIDKPFNSIVYKRIYNLFDFNTDKEIELTSDKFSIEEIIELVREHEKKISNDNILQKVLN